MTMRIIAGKFKGRTLFSPTDSTIRPTSDRNRETLFNILTNRYKLAFNQCRVLDLFAGTGALGFEALSRGAISATFVEKSAAARAIIHRNIEALSVEGVTRILRRDAQDLGSIGRLLPFNLVFVDPPYAQTLGEKALISAYEGGWLTKDTLIILEEDISAAITLAPAFCLQDERCYGRSTLRFYTVSTHKNRQG